MPRPAHMLLVPALVGLMGPTVPPASSPPAPSPPAPAPAAQEESAPLTDAPPAIPPSAPPPGADAAALQESPPLERQTISMLLANPAWPQRALAAMRLERFGCDETAAMLRALLRDASWQVRTFATRTLGRRRLPAAPDLFASEAEPRVLRTAMRYRYPQDPQRIARGVQLLARSSNVEDLMLAAELALPLHDEKLDELAGELLRKVILRMKRVEAGALSPRLAAVTGQTQPHTPYEWQRWLSKQPRPLALQSAVAFEEGARPPAPGLLASLETARFSDLESYITSLRERRVDLAIAIDCTASMGGELAAAQASLDDMMLFFSDVVAELRVGLVAYRDRQDQFEIKPWDFTTDVAEARKRLWSLTAEGGGDTPESVYPALRAAYGQLSWKEDHVKVLILVGDAPPHVGTGVLCVALSRAAAAGGRSGDGREFPGVITHVIQAKGRPVKHFPEIAEAGGGRCVLLRGEDALVGEITGLTIDQRFSDEIRELFATYLELCR